MAAGAVGTVWLPGTWPDTCWELGAWGDVADEVPPVIALLARYGGDGALEQRITSGLFTGEDKVLQFTIQDADGDPQLIPGWSLSWMVKRWKKAGDSAAILTKATGSGLTITSVSGGVCQVTLEDTDLADLVGDVLYHHELKRTDAGLETVLAYGHFMLTQAVHQ